MKRFAFIALLLGLGFVAGCDNKPKTPAKVETTPPAGKAVDDAAAPKDGAAATDKPADKDAGDKEDMPEEK